MEKFLVEIRWKLEGVKSYMLIRGIYRKVYQDSVRYFIFAWIVFLKKDRHLTSGKPKCITFSEEESPG